MKKLKLFLVLVCIIVSGIEYSCAQSRNAEHSKLKIPKAMFLSDFHIGEVYGAVTRVLPKDSLNRTKYDSLLVDKEYIYYRSEVKDLLNTLHNICGGHSKIPYLILVGDICDMAVHNASDGLNLAHSFFNSKGICHKRAFTSYFKNIIYLSGNHDHHILKMLQELYYITHSLEKHGKALPLPQQILGVLDLKNDHMKAKDHLIFPHPKENFLSRVLSNNTLPVYYAYPNLYIKVHTKDSSDICVTHGQFFEPGWNKTVFNYNYRYEKMSPSAYFSEIEQSNSPLSEFSDYSVAQATQSLAQGINDIQYGDSTNFRKLSHIEEMFSELIPMETKKPKKHSYTDIQKLLEQSLLVDPYLWQTKRQMSEYHLKFKTLIYGHTHVPCNNVKYKKFIDDQKGFTFDIDININNTGGWVNIDSVSKPNPLFLYKDGSIEKVLDN